LKKDENVPSKVSSRKTILKIFFFGLLKFNDEKQDPDPYQKVTDPQHRYPDQQYFELLDLYPISKSMRIRLHEIKLTCSESTHR
jgi:hypothetical protein